MDTHYDLHSFSSARDLAQDAASRFVHAWARADGPLFTCALSGGRIAKTFYSEIVARAGAVSPQQAAKLHLFWADERSVPPDNQESNYLNAQETLIHPLHLKPHQIHRIQGELPPAEAARLAQQELEQVTGSPTPSLDLVWLGMGEDGHVASLFPGEPDELITSPDPFRPVTAPKPPPNRVTMGYPLLTAAHQVWVLASGTGKEAALRTSLVGEPPFTPLARLLSMRRQSLVLTDIPTAEMRLRPAIEG